MYRQILEQMDFGGSSVGFFQTCFVLHLFWFSPWNCKGKFSLKMTQKWQKKSFFDIFANNHFHAKPYDRFFNYDQFYKFSRLLCQFGPCCDRKNSESAHTAFRVFLQHILMLRNLGYVSSSGYHGVVFQKLHKNL